MRNSLLFLFNSESDFLGKSIFGVSFALRVFDFDLNLPTTKKRKIAFSILIEGINYRSTSHVIKNFYCSGYCDIFIFHGDLLSQNRDTFLNH